MSNNSFEAPRFVRDVCEGAFETGRGGRVLRADGSRLLIRTSEGEARVELSRSQQQAAPCVAGDWLELGAHGEVRRRLPRRNRLARKAAGKRNEEQVIAANIDLVLIVMGLDGDFSVRRVERYLTLAYEAQAAPIVFLTKASGCPNVEAYLSEVHAVAGEAPVYAIDVIDGIAADVPARCLLPGLTAVMVGSSGVGKSTLLNHLLQSSEAATQPVRERDCTGRHTTTFRELHYLESGAAIIDTPGMREVQLWAGVDALETAFQDVAALASACRYRDCRHAGEPGCALTAAVALGELDSARVESFERLRSELTTRTPAQRRADGRVQARAIRAHLRLKDRED